jgi:hypothetical protein
MSSSSSEDEDYAKFAGIAVDASDIVSSSRQAQATAAARREAALQRRMGGDAGAPAAAEGRPGLAVDDGQAKPDQPLDLTQVKVRRPRRQLQRHLQQRLRMQAV